MRVNSLKLFSLISSALLFSSCLTATADLTLRSDGGGLVSLDYRVSKFISGLEKDSLTGRRLFPLPLSEQEFQEKASQSSGITIRRISGRADLNYSYIQSEFTFNSAAELSEFLGVSVVLEQDGAQNSLTLQFLDQNQPIGRETQDVISELFKDDSLTFAVTVPGNIRSSDFGNVRNNGRSVDYAVRLEDLYRNAGFSWRLEWQ